MNEKHSMSETKIQEVMALVDNYAAIYAPVGGDIKFRARAAIERALREQVREQVLDERTAFENWIIQIHPGIDLYRRADGEYWSSTPDSFWEAWQARAALTAAAQPEQTAAPMFEGIAKRKLDDLLAKGVLIDGLAFSSVSPDGFDAPRQRGHITTGGAVYWWTSDEEIRRRERAAADRALRERFSDEKQREVPDESPGEGWDSFFEKRLPSLARAHPSLLVRQLAQRMLSAAPTQPAQVSQPKAAQQEPVHQFRIRGQSSWCDGLIPTNANPEDFVTRTLYTEAPQLLEVSSETTREPMTCKCFDDAAKRYCPNKATCSEVIAYGITKKEQA